MQVKPSWAGTDEVGRGCLAGPVVAAAVTWKNGQAPVYVDQLRDSKKLAPRKRKRLAIELVSDDGVSWSIAWRNSDMIDKINILQASLQAMAQSANQLLPLAGVYVDGNQKIPVNFEQQTVTGGDDLVPQIAAASIIAKVFRDQWMASLDLEYPGYGFTGNKGYGTADHRRAIHELGPIAIHRKSFAPIKQMHLFS